MKRASTIDRTNQRVVVRLGRVRDLADAVELLAVQLREHRIRMPQRKIESALRAMMRKPALGFLIVARAGGPMVGVAYVSHQWTLEYGGLTAWLEELYMLPEWRNRGIGRQLLLAVIARARSLGCAAVDLEVERDHGRSEHLYRREGFIRYHRARWALRLR